MTSGIQEKEKEKLLNTGNDINGGLNSKYSAIQSGSSAAVSNIKSQVSDSEHGTDLEIKNNEIRVYKRRWYVLILFSLLAFTQGSFWITWGPIAASSEYAFGWSDADIALYANWGPIAFIVTALVMSWIVDVKGLRWACVLAAFLVAASGGIRCITDKPPYVKWTANIAQILNGIAGPVCFGVAPVLSSIWFPTDQRTTATALSVQISGLSGAVQFLLGPYLVPDPGVHNNSSMVNESLDGLVTKAAYNETGDRIPAIRNDIMNYMYIQAGWSGFILILILVYFPAKPPTPPTKSASMDRIDYKQGLKCLLRHKKFWIICITYSLCTGVFECWQNVFDTILKPHDISQEEVGWISFYSILSGCVAGVFVAKLADCFSKHIRFFLIVEYIGSVACVLWFIFTITGVLPDSTASLYSSVILASTLIATVTPLYFEMACEATYPIAEGTTNLALTFMNNIVGFIFLLIQMVPGIGTGWENWCLLGGIASCIPALFLLKERYNRLNVDQG